MPAFTFEKISPPVRRAPDSPGAGKQRGIISQILKRLVEARVERGPCGPEKDVTARDKAPE